MEALLQLPQKLLWVVYENFEQTPLPILLILAITTAVTVLTCVCTMLPTATTFVLTQCVGICHSIYSCTYAATSILFRENLHNNCPRWLYHGPKATPMLARRMAFPPKGSREHKRLFRETHRRH